MKDKAGSWRIETTERNGKVTTYHLTCDMQNSEKFEINFYSVEMKPMLESMVKRLNAQTPHPVANFASNLWRRL